MTLALHVVAGAVALAAGFAALAARKGGPAHRRAGRLFALAMLAMSLSGVAIAAVAGVAPAVNVPAGLATAYLVTTAFTTVLERTARLRRLDRFAMCVATVVGIACLWLALTTAAGGGSNRGFAFPLLGFGIVTALGAVGDRRMLRLERGPGVAAAARLPRHLWRMSVALFIAAGSFFLGQADELPQSLRRPLLLAVPVALPLLAMAYWLWRTRRAETLPVPVRAEGPGWLERMGRGRVSLDEDDFSDEIAAHLAIATSDRIAAGLDPAAAREASIREFGNLALTTETARGVWTPRWLSVLQDLAADVRQARRGLARHPAFSLTVVGVLSLGIALNATVFSMLKSMALTPLAGVARSSALTAVYAETDAGRSLRLSYREYRQLRDRHTAFSSLLGYRLANVTVGRGRSARQLSAELVSGNYFQALGVAAQAGRTLLPSDEVAPGRHPIVVVSDGYWRGELNADPDAVGRTIVVNNNALTVVGVAEPGFHGTIVSYDVELFIPVMTAPQLGITFGTPPGTPPSDVLAHPAADVLYALGHLRPGRTRASAAAETDALWRDLAAQRPAGDSVVGLRVVPFWRLPGTAQSVMLPMLAVLTAMGLLVLLIACANIAGLVIVRAISRRGEIAMRLALGAGRARIVRLLLVENLLLAVPGAVLGVLLSGQALAWLVGQAEVMAVPQRLFLNVQTDALVVAFSVAAACGSALTFGFLPALRSSRLDFMATLHDESPRGSSRSRVRATLVVAQVAVSLLLLVGAGLVSRSLDAARLADPGFDARQVSTVTLDVKANAYTEARGRAFYRDLLASLRAAPGIESATMAQYTPMAFLETRRSPVVVDDGHPSETQDLSLLTNTTGPDYFHALRIPLRAGREFTDEDGPQSAPVAVVNVTLAERFWGSAANAIGKRLRVADGEWRTVVGVAADVKYLTINEGPRPYVYLPFLQDYRTSMIVHVRGEAPLSHLVDVTRDAVADLDADLPVLAVSSLERETRGSLIIFQLMALMLFVFGAAGLLLAGLGTYGLVAYTVRQSTHEIGIRLALGASRASVVRAVVGRGLRLSAIGVVLGTAAALGASRLLSGFLYGITATDAVSFAQALAIVGAGVALATALPASRAARMNPLVALRRQ
jgi:predicted permease